MQRSEFEQMLAREGYSELVVVDRTPGGSLDVHSHPFAAKALILDGEIRIRCGDDERRYQAGDVFQLAADVPHAEYYGPAGVRYLVGRK